MQNAWLTDPMKDVETPAAAAATEIAAAAKPFPKILPSVGWIALYFILQGFFTIVLLTAGVADSPATATTPSALPNPVVILWGLILAAIVQLLLMWLYVRKDARLELLGLTHFGRLSAVQTLAMAMMLVVAAMFFNFIYATYVIPGIGMQEDMAKLLSSIPRTPANIAAGVFAIVVAAPLVEELLFRGFLQNSLARHMPFWAAIILSSFGFALVHGQPYAIPGLMSLSLAFGYIYHRTGSLRTNIILHMVNNAVALVLLAQNAS